MPSYAFERLSARENRFLLLESPETPMHATSVAIYQTGPLATPGGGVDIARFKHFIESLLHQVPRYRQKLKMVPIENHPVWIDDPHFNIDFHVRHAALPRPGTDEELKKKVARIMVQPLDRARPLWETWVIEQLEGNRFAVISKVHHCVLDPSQTADLAQISMSTDRDQQVSEARPFLPGPEPTGAELLRGEWSRRTALPGRVLDRWQEIRSESENLVGGMRSRIGALAGWLTSGPSETPLNGSIGPHRRFEWLTFALADLKAIHQSLGCTINDAVLTIVTGAVRRFLLHRHTDPDQIDFRVSIPLSVRVEDDEADGPTSEVRLFIIDLPVGESDAKVQLGAIADQTAKLKTASAVLGAEMIMAVAEWTPSALFSRAARALAGPLPVNLSVSNVPGPQQPLYLLGSQMVEWFGAAPLSQHTGLAISLVSYNGRVCWGFSADRDLVPDLVQLVSYVRESLGELAHVAGVEAKGLPAEVFPEPEVSHEAPS